MAAAFVGLSSWLDRTGSSPKLWPRSYLMGCYPSMVRHAQRPWWLLLSCLGACFNPEAVEETTATQGPTGASSDAEATLGNTTDSSNSASSASTDEGSATTTNT